MSLVLRRGTLPDGGTGDVRCTGGRIAAVADRLEAEPGDEVVDIAGHLVLPAPAEPHAHLDKALTADRVANPRGDLLGAIEVWTAYRETLTVDDIAERAEAAARRLLAAGVTAIRTHVDVSSSYGLRGVEALQRVRANLAGLLDLQVVALVAVPTGGAAGLDNRLALRDALAAGADVAGGCPHLDPEPLACLDACFQEAVDAGVPLDLHTDETLNPTVLGLRDLARRVLATGFDRPTTASHCCSLGVQEPALRDAVAAEVAEAGVAVVTLPQTNLFLLGRGHPVATPRGLTAGRALLDAGAVLGAGADNLQDPFNPVGRADPLETAALLVMAGHLTVDEAYSAVSAGARRAMGLEPVTVAPGAPAELVAVPSPSLRAAVADAPTARVVVHRGRIVAGPPTPA